MYYHRYNPYWRRPYCYDRYYWDFYKPYNLYGYDPYMPYYYSRPYYY